MGICGEPDKKTKTKKRMKNDDIDDISEKGKQKTKENKKGEKKKNDDKSKNDNTTAPPETNENKINENDKGELEEKEKEKEYKNEEREESEEEEIGNINKDKSNDEKNIVNYKDLKNDADYYIRCPNCKKCLPYIKQIDYDTDKKDFKLDCFCGCGSSNEIYFYTLIDENEPENKCLKHPENRLIYFCKKCNNIICDLCKEEDHNNHEIINNCLSQEEIERLQNIAEEKKDEFEGYEIFNKILKKICFTEKRRKL